MIKKSILTYEVIAIAIVWFYSRWSDSDLERQSRLMDHYTFIYVHLLILACLCYVITVGVRVQINNMEKSKLVFWRVSILWKILREVVDNSNITTTYVDKIKISLFVIFIVKKGKLHSRWKDLSLKRCKGIPNCVVLH